MTMDGSTLVSVIVAVYNVGPFIEECVLSITDQSYANLEIVLVDDGSTDGSERLIDYFAGIDNRIIAIHKDNGGPSAARNVGLSVATGEFVTFVDGDDALFPQFIEYMLTTALRSDADYVIAKTCISAIGRDKLETDLIDDAREISSDEAIGLLFSPQIVVGCWNKLYRREFIENNGLRFYENLRSGEGLEFTTRAASFANRIVLCTGGLYFYRRDNASSATIKPNVLINGVGGIEAMKQMESTLELKSPFTRKMFNWRYWCHYGDCLRQIIEMKFQEKFHNLYKKCIKERRRRALLVVNSPVSWKQKLIAVATVCSPVLIARYYTWARARIARSLALNNK